MNIKEKARKAGKFMKENKVLMAQLAVMGVVAVSCDPAFAESSGTDSFKMITGPLESIQETLRGPVSTAVGTIGAIILGGSVAMGAEQQTAKRGMQIAGGVGLGVGGAKAVTTLMGATGMAMVPLF